MFFRGLYPWSSKRTIFQTKPRRPNTRQGLLGKHPDWPAICLNPDWLVHDSNLPTVCLPCHQVPYLPFTPPPHKALCKLLGQPSRDCFLGNIGRHSNIKCRSSIVLLRRNWVSRSSKTTRIQLCLGRSDSTGRHSINAYHFPCLVTDVAARSVDDGFNKADLLAHYQIKKSKTRGGCTFDSSEELKLYLTLQASVVQKLDSVIYRRKPQSRE